MPDPLAVVQKVQELVTPVLEQQGFECVDIVYLREHGRWVLRLLVDKPGGITLDDCEMVSRSLSPVLDTLPELAGSYNLEISSPGINRPLKKEVDFKRFAGEKARIKLYAPLEGRRNFLGILKDCHDKTVYLEEEGNLIAIALDSIAKAHLEGEIRGARYC